MLIDELVETAPPPASPVDRGSDDKWGAVTEYFGKTLPMDYMAFIDRYGTVVLNDLLRIFNPFAREEHQNLINRFPYLLSILSGNKEEAPELCPYPLMFEPGGLLPWGDTVDGDIFCWTTSGMSGRWKIVVLNRYDEPQEFDHSMVAFLLATLRGEIECSAIPSHGAERPGTFETGTGQ